MSYKFLIVILRRHNKTRTCLKYLQTSGRVSTELGKPAHTIWHVYGNNACKAGNVGGEGMALSMYFQSFFLRNYFHCLRAR
jgi:hypothetical protein